MILFAKRTVVLGVVLLSIEKSPVSQTETWTHELRLLKEERYRRLMAEESVPNLSSFVAQTSLIQLDPWQTHLCDRLERLRSERGQRIAIHAPPQLGKSLIVSQRFPAWYLGVNPEARIKLACYNITQATRHGRIVRQILSDQLYMRMFPQPNRRIPYRSRSEEFSNAARMEVRDGQPSFKSLGLATGFIGQGADVLVIDDPYASPQDAASETIRASTWSFWDESARVRLTEDTNVVVMFHRYHHDDLAGRLFSEEGLVEDGGRWEVMRYAAQADGEPYCMPEGRLLGEYLSPRLSSGWYQEQEAKGQIWLSQFQGTPSVKGGQFFEPDRIGVVDKAPENLLYCRAWDLAATEGSGDWTVGALLGMDELGNIYICDVVRGRWGPSRVDATVYGTAEQDQSGTMTHLAQDPGSAGKRTAHGLVDELKKRGHRAMYQGISGSKESRAWGFASTVNSGKVNMVRAAWNLAFREELRAFPIGKHDDQIDASSDAYNWLIARLPSRDNVSKRSKRGGYV